MNLYNDQFLSTHDFPLNKSKKVLIIASTGRSGSHMLGHSLHQTDCFGFPLEYVNEHNLQKWKQILKTHTLEDTLNKIKQKRTSNNGVFSIKIHYEHIKQFGTFDGVKNMFPNAYYILLSRENVLKQAVSYAMASKTGIWISGQEPVNSHPKYDFKLIENSLRRIILDNASWRYTLAANGCNYLELSFEEVRASVKKSILRIANFMNVEVNEENIPEKPVTKKQSNSLSNEWEKRFLKDYSNNELIEPQGILEKIKKIL